MDYQPQTTHRHRRLISRVLLGAVLGGIAFAAAGHEGALDSFGCHPNVAHGSYHCHAGLLNGLGFVSKEKMLEAYKEHQQDERVRARFANPPQADNPAPATP